MVYASPSGLKLRNVLVSFDDPILVFSTFLNNTLGKGAPSKLRSACILVTKKNNVYMGWKLSNQQVVVKPKTEESIMEFLKVCYVLFDRVLMEYPGRSRDGVIQTEFEKFSLSDLVHGKVSDAETKERLIQRVEEFVQWYPIM